MAGKKSNQELRHGTQRILVLSDAIARIVTHAIKWGSLVAISYFGYKAIQSLSGQTTLANFAVHFLGNVAINHWLYLLLTGGGGVWGYCERRLRRKKVAELGDRIQNLEKLVDKNRSSSSLPRSGTTRAED